MRKRIVLSFRVVAGLLLTLGASQLFASEKSGDKKNLHNFRLNSRIAIQERFQFHIPSSRPAKPTPTAPSGAKGTVRWDIDQCVFTEMLQAGNPAMQVAVMVDGKLIHDQGYGVISTLLPLPATNRTSFRTGSIGKMLTAAAAMQQVEKGKLRLDDPVGRLIEGFSLDSKWPYDGITLQRLLSHTSGIPDGGEIDGPKNTHAMGDYVHSLATVTPFAPAGTFYNYSNPGYSVVGYLIELASGMPYRDYMHKEVFARAGMNSTTFDTDKVMAGSYSLGHFTDGSGEEHIYLPNSYEDWASDPAGNAFTTAHDLVQWASLLMNDGGSVISKQSAQLIQAGKVNMREAGVPTSYGFGIVSFQVAGMEFYTHDGYVPGWGSSLIWVPDKKFAVAVLTNRNTPVTSPACIVRAILDIDPSEPDLHPMSSFEPLIGHYEGTFMDGNPVTVEITINTQGQLMAETNITDLPPEEQIPIMRLLPVDGMNFEGDTDLDGQGDFQFPITFVDTNDQQPRRMWLRTRIMVAERTSIQRPTGPSIATP